MKTSMGFFKPPAAAALPSLTYVTSIGHASTNQTTWTFSSASVGAAGATRKSILGITTLGGNNNNTISSVTVDGVAATEIIDTNNAAPVNAALYIINNPTGTTANIVVTTSASAERCSLSIWAAYDLTSSTPTDTAQNFQTSSAALALSLDVAANGIAVGVSGNGDPATTTWVGFTERVDATVGGNKAYSAADITVVAASTPLTVTCDWSGSDDAIGVTASFR